jgi:surfactin synthase thioesterase subunit
VHRHDDHELGDVLRFLGFGPSRALLADKDLRRAMLPTIRADFEVCASYVDTHRAPLELPVAVIAGDQDPFATPAEVARWRDVISGELDFSLLPGDHYFLFPEREAVLGVVRRMAAIVTQR